MSSSKVFTYLESCDMFSKQVGLTMKNKYRYSTMCGASITLLVFILMMIYLTIMIIQPIETGAGTRKLADGLSSSGGGYFDYLYRISLEEVSSLVGFLDTQTQKITFEPDGKNYTFRPVDDGFMVAFMFTFTIPSSSSFFYNFWEHTYDKVNGHLFKALNNTQGARSDFPEVLQEELERLMVFSYFSGMNSTQFSLK